MVMLPQLYPSFDDRVESGSPVPSFVPPKPVGPPHGVISQGRMRLTGSSSPSIQVVDDEFGFAEAGKLAGLWFGMVWSLSTLPVVAIDGPLPIADIGWAYYSLRITKNAMDTGEQIGEVIDNLIE